MQPLALKLRLRGETIVGMEPPSTGYCRRGIAPLVESARVEDALAVVERSCSLAGTAHRTALCQAIESATGTAVAPTARLTRVVFLEVERILARLWLLGTTARAASLPAPFKDALKQRETLYAALETATGQRVYWAVAIPGGARTDLDLTPLREVLDGLVPDVVVWRAAVAPTGPLGRTGQGMGVLAGERAEALQLTGIAAGGSGDAPDARRDQPSGGYADLSFAWPEGVSGAGDVAARMRYAVENIATSLDLTQACFEALETAGEPSAAAALKVPGAPAAGQATVEGPHGPVTVRADLTPALTIARFHLETPGATLLASLPEVLEGRPLAHAPAVLASLDLCMECIDQ